MPGNIPRRIILASILIPLAQGPGGRGAALALSPSRARTDEPQSQAGLRPGGRNVGTARSGDLAGTRALVTPSDVEATLRRLGVRERGVVLVHASLSALGFVVHGAEGVFQALRRVLGPSGTLLVPTFTGESMDPSCWVDPALPSALWNEIRDGMPLYDKQRSLPRMMGQLALTIALDPEAARSEHPLASFAAIGPRSAELVQGHDLRDPFGPCSPLGRALALDADVLLLGVDQTRNSAIYLAQCVADVPQVRRNRGAFLASVDGERQWITPERMPECSSGFGRVEDELVTHGLIRVALLGDATCRLMRMQPLITFLQYHLRLYPRSTACARPDCRQCA